MFPYNSEIDNRLHTCEEALEANIYKKVDLKVKVFTKQENKQPVLKNGKTSYKSDCIVSDSTESIKEVLWEQAIEQVETGKSYHFQNLTIRCFDDTKFVNTNEYTTITQISDIADAKVKTSDLEDHHITGKIIAANVKSSECCIVCNHILSIDKEKQSEDDMIECPNCKMSILTSVVCTKLVCQLMIKTSTAMTSYTAFNDAIQTYLHKIKHPTPLEDIEMKDLESLLLHAGEQSMIVDKSIKKISQFL